MNFSYIDYKSERQPLRSKSVNFLSEDEMTSSSNISEINLFDQNFISPTFNYNYEDNFNLKSKKFTKKKNKLIKVENLLKTQKAKIYNKENNSKIKMHYSNNEFQTEIIKFSSFANSDFLLEKIRKRRGEFLYNLSIFNKKIEKLNRIVNEFN